MEEDQIIIPKNVTSLLNIFKIEWVDGQIKCLFNNKVMKLRNGKDAVFEIPDLYFSYALLGRCDRYRNPCKKAKFHKLKIAKFVEDNTTPVDPPPVDPPEPPEEPEPPKYIEWLTKLWESIDIWVRVAILLLVIILFSIIASSG